MVMMMSNIQHTEDASRQLRKELDAIEEKTNALYDNLAMQMNEGMIKNLVELELWRSHADFISNEFLQLKEKAMQKAKELSLSISHPIIGDDAKAFGSSDTSLSNLEGETKGMNDDLTHVLSLDPWSYILGGSKVVTKLSEFYDVLHTCSCSNDTQATPENWVPPSVFQRSTHKYWVDMQSLSDVMLNCISEVPILLYGKAVIESTCDSDIWNSTSTSITSIYFDSPGSMVLYKDRIKRIECAQLFRIRWYGKTPSPDGIVFLELKTHHEQWVNNQSVKERVALRSKEVSRILMRHIDGESNCSVEDLAKGLALNAKPDLSKKEIHDAVDLLIRIRHLVLENNLEPCVRSSYRRMSFQSNSSNALRFTIDRDVQLSSEAGSPKDEYWLDDDAYLLAPSVTLPVAIFEVKLNGVAAPAWVDTLLTETKISDGHKFSKYLTGASIHYPKNISTLPYWAPYPSFKYLFHDIFVNNNSDTESSSSTHIAAQISDETSKENSDSSKRSKVVSESNRNLTASAALRKRLSNLRSSLRTRKKKQKSLEVLPVAPKQKVRIEPKTFFAAERTFIQWISVALLLVTFSALLFTFSKDNSNDPKPKVLAVGLTIISLIVCIYSLGSYFRRLYLLQNGKQYGYTDHFPPIALTLSVLAGIGCFIYYTMVIPGQNVHSSKVMYSKSEECYKTVYNGGISPFVFQPSDVTFRQNQPDIAYLPSVSQIVTINHFGTSKEASSDNDSITHDLQVVASVDGADIESLVWVDDVLYALCEADSLLYAFRNNSESNDTMDMIGRWKISKAAEGMTYVPPDTDNINDNGKLYIRLEGGIGVFDVPLIDSMATSVDNKNAFSFFESKFSPTTALSMAPMSESIEEEEEIPKLKPQFNLNFKLMTRGLGIDITNIHVSSMQYFENILYILFDNARVIRGYNLHTGDIVNEIKVPKVSSDGEFDKQWEGMFFERIDPTKAGNNDSRSLRGTSSAYHKHSTVKLHMALDTPPEMWTFMMTEEMKVSQSSAYDQSTIGDITSSTFQFPECAAAY